MLVGRFTSKLKEARWQTWFQGQSTIWSYCTKLTFKDEMILKIAVAPVEQLGGPKPQLWIDLNAWSADATPHGCGKNRRRTEHDLWETSQNCTGEPTMSQIYFVARLVMSAENVFHIDVPILDHPVSNPNSAHQAHLTSFPKFSFNLSDGPPKSHPPGWVATWTSSTSCEKMDESKKATVTVSWHKARMEQELVVAVGLLVQLCQLSSIKYAEYYHELGMFLIWIWFLLDRIMQWSGFCCDDSKSSMLHLWRMYQECPWFSVWQLLNWWLNKLRVAISILQKYVLAAALWVGIALKLRILKHHLWVGQMVTSHSGWAKLNMTAITMGDWKLQKGLRGIS